ncbi:MAG: hypothetical protein JRH20_02685 [Deltaproteobacteria bacterium]|nr:hypothetical protein [Deltaproteobacteria bacterium]
MRAGRGLVLLWTLLLVAGGSGELWAAPKAKVGLVPITSTGKKARRVAKKLTRKLVKSLRRGRGKGFVVVKRRAAAYLRKCLQDKACRLRESHKLGVDYWLTGHLLKMDGRYHIDLQIVGKSVGVIGSRSVDGTSRKLLKSCVGCAKKLVADAAKKGRALARKRRGERARRAAVEKQAQRMDRTDEPPSADALTLTPKTPANDDRGFLSSVFAGRYWMAWTATGLTVASLGGAITFGVVSSSSASDAESDTITQVEAWKHQDQAQRNATMANIFFGVSGALAIASGVLFYLEYRQDMGERSHAPAPKTSMRLLPGLGGLSLVGTF